MKKVSIVICLILSLFLSPGMGLAQGNLDQRLNELSEQISNEMTQYDKTTIAVVELTDLRGDITEFGQFLAEELITRLYQTKMFKIIERQLLSRVMAEQKLSLTGMIDPTSAKELGRLLGVDAIVSGTVTDLGQSLKVNARLINTETGEIFAVASTEILKDEAVRKLMSTGIESAKSVREAADKSIVTTLQKIEMHDFTFELKGCKFSGGIVTCNLVVTNNDKDRILKIDNYYCRNPHCAVPTKMFDNFGNEYIAKQFQLADKRGARVSSLLISDLSTKLSVIFEGVSAEASKITMLEVGCFSKKRVTLQIPNIPFILLLLIIFY